MLAPCQLAAGLTGGPDRATTISASSRYGMRALTFRLPRGMHLNTRARRDLGSASFMSAGYPARKFTLVGARTNWNDVAIRLRRHTITVTKLPIQTGVININLRPGVVEGRTGNLTVIAKTRAANARQTASAQASWFR